MNKLKIRTYPDSILKKKAEEVVEVALGPGSGPSKEIRQLADDMIETMREDDGVGLAGPQVGKSLRIFVIDAFRCDSRQASDGEGARVFINPQILKKRGHQKGNEGCLSLPGIETDIKRAKSLKCRFLDKEGKEKEIEACGVLAKIIQHENDHLDGKLFIDRVGWLRRKKLLKAYRRYGDMIEGGKI